MSTANKVLEDLLEGRVVKTDLAACKRYGTNQVPDKIRKLRRHYKIETNLAKKTINGTTTHVALYTMPQAERERIFLAQIETPLKLEQRNDKR